MTGAQGRSPERLQDVLISVAPVVGTARSVTAAGNAIVALGTTDAVADAQGQRSQRREPFPS
ncbi:MULTISPECIES: hypothetical protein [unclassified Streptomyces]|uniref:hypothetical protein n=1 Tax=unclassified Streptomyces TaxID=2593676 RepID=UPI002E2C977F|nr:hypothetical protein [Streptomyces sp. NBC_00273]